MHPYHTHFPVFPSTALTHETPPEKKRRKHKSDVCCSYTHWGAWSNSQEPASWRKLSPSPPGPLTEAISCGELYLSIFITICKSPLSMVSFLGCYFWVMGCHGSLLCPSSSVSSHRCHWKGSFLVLYRKQEHGLWASTWCLATTWTTDIHMVSHISTYHRPQHGLWW